MTMTLARPLSIMLVGAATAVVGMSTSYADRKTYTGAECVRWNESKDPASYLEWSRRLNRSNKKRLRLDCPAVKDRSGNLQSSWIRVIDRSPNERVCARIVAVRQVNKSLMYKQGARKCTRRALRRRRPVQLATGGLKGVPADASYYFSVTIPRRSQGRDSGVVSYRINERDSKD